MILRLFAGDKDNKNEEMKVRDKEREREREERDTERERDKMEEMRSERNLQGVMSQVLPGRTM